MLVQRLFIDTCLNTLNRQSRLAVKPLAKAGTVLYECLWKKIICYEGLSKKIVRYKHFEEASVLRGPLEADSVPKELVQEECVPRGPVEEDSVQLGLPRYPPARALAAGAWEFGQSVAPRH